MFDLIIKNGTVIDGTGSPGIKADIAVSEGKISEIGSFDESEAKEIVEANNIDYIENRCTKMEYQKIFLKKLQAFPVLINR